MRQDEVIQVGDRVACDFHHMIPATVTSLEDGGFCYELDWAHELGPRQGWIEGGWAKDFSGWVRLPGNATKETT